MEFVKNLLGDSGCNVDGSFTSHNPVGAVVNRIFDSAMLAEVDPIMSSGTGDLIAGSGVIYTDPQQYSNGLHIYANADMVDIAQSDMRMRELDGMQSTGSINTHMFPYGDMNYCDLQQVMGMQHMATLMQHQALMNQQHEAWMQQNFQNQRMHMLAAKNHQFSSSEVLNNLQNEHYHEDLQSDIDSAILNAMQEEDLSVEKLDDIWERFQQYSQLDANHGASKSGLDAAWAGIQEKIATQSAAQADAYDFVKQNQYLAMHQASSLSAHSAQIKGDQDLFGEGMQRFREGDIAQAILAFEADVQVNYDHAESWRMLGMCHAENDMDKEAIVCLKKAVECDPYNLEALLALGTSYVNELDSAGALTMLKEWVLHHPAFCGLSVPADEYSDGTLMDEVMQLILAAHEHAPNDVDVKILLGVLYNVSQNFDQAAQLFQQAVQIKPDDYTLYNKLGATLANSNGSHDAIPLYKQALEMRPRYARGWLNLGISHANLNEYEEAARAYVKALQQNPKGKHIWGYLRVVFTCMDDLDAVELCGREDLRTLLKRLNIDN